MNTPTLTLFRLTGREWWNRSNRLDSSEFLKYSILAGSLTLFVVEGTFIVSIVFRFLLDKPPIGEILIRKMMHMATLASWLLLVVTSVIMSFSVFYLADDLRYLFSLPVRAYSIFYPKFARCLWLSSWAIVILVSPMYLAMGHTLGDGWTPYLMLLLAVPAFVISGVAAGILASLLVSPFFSAGRSRKTVVISLVALAGIAILMAKMLGLSTMSGHQAVQVVDDMIVTKVGELWYLPPYWLLQVFQSSMGITGDMGITADLASAWFFTGLLWSTAGLVMLPILWIVHETNLYERGFARTSEGTPRARKRNGSRTASGFLAPLRRMGSGQASALLSKDLRLFLRTPSQWMQFSLLVVLVIVYLTSARKALIDTTELFWHNVAVIVNLALTGFVVASLAVRFFYPHLAQEGRTAWILNTSPYLPRRVFWTKFSCGLLINLAVTQILIWLSLFFLDADISLVTLCAVAGLFLSAAITALAYCLGAVFPAYRSEHPAEIASEMGGLLTLILCVLIVSGGVVLLAWPIQQFLREPVGWPIFAEGWTQVSLGLVIVLSLAIAAPCLVIGPRALARKEV